ncbi:hypothetical protein ACFU98_47535 [Streptomyces sp. NPDC057575]|uniref:hypothetical protein n=1 Tax=unclassified Streptomyces TaxID=2593676 RepID=UPI003688E2AF
MATHTSAAAFSADWCHWHKGPSGTAVLVDVIEQASGPGAGLYACAPCREQRGLVPLTKQSQEVAYRTYLLHTAACADCDRPGRCGEGASLYSAYREALAATDQAPPS